MNRAGDFALVSAPVKGDPTSKAAVQAIERVRDDYVPAAFPEGRRPGPWWAGRRRSTRTSST